MVICPYCHSELPDDIKIDVVSAPERGVMWSIRPEWCLKIIQKKKTLEVRKHIPVDTPPYKCYIYCTVNGKGILNVTINGEKKTFNGKVIGEFTCDGYTTVLRREAYGEEFEKLLEKACLTEEQYKLYADEQTVYFLNIKDLKIYSEPRDLEDYGVKSPPLRFQYVGKKGGGTHNHQRPLLPTAVRRERERNAQGRN